MALRKPAGTWTYEDLFSLPDDGRRYEIIEGELYEMPGPTSIHALVITALMRLLLPVVDRLGGVIVTAPLDVFFLGADPVQPDLTVLLSDSRAQVVRRGIEGPPDLIVEVLSPSNRGHDLLTKRALYARAGVREYWIVDPEAKTLEILALDRDALHSIAIASGDDVPTSPLFGSLAVSVDSLFPDLDEA